MQPIHTAYGDSASSLRTATTGEIPNSESATSGVAWPAIWGGAFAAAAFSLILFSLGAGLGLSSFSPWTNGNAGAAMTMMAAVWIIVVQWLASGLGGYLTGRMRVRHAKGDSDEVFFRDTAHGFLSWCVATLLVAGLLGSATSAVMYNTAQAPEAQQTAGANAFNPLAYYADSLFRSDHPPADINADQAARAEAMRIMAMNLGNENMNDADRVWLAQLVAARTGIDAAAAEKRVNDMLAQQKTIMKDTSEAARKTSAAAAIFTCLALLVGAFIASAAGGLGGRHRDML